MKATTVPGLLLALAALPVRVAVAQTEMGPPTAQAPPPKETPAAPPTVQRPEEPVVRPPAPSQPPPSGTLRLAYVRGPRVILTGHKENYFISGFSRAAQIKFQYSAKFDLWPNASRHSGYFAFTQKSFWRIRERSSPFDDSDYNPELFYGYYKRSGDIDPRPGQVLPFIQNARLGLEHESNGQGGASSRAWNRVYGYIRFGLYVGESNYFTIAPKAWVPVFSLDDNPDIADYVGNGSLTAEYGVDPASRHWYGSFLIGATARKGWVGSRYGLEAYAQWRPGYQGDKLRWFKFTPYVYAQLSTGYGESLLSYNHSDTAIRVGISFEDKVNWQTVVRSDGRGSQEEDPL
jgi:phospholipase A1/A2